MLLKQDKLSLLEQRLERIDQEETSLLFLGKSRCDGNRDRLSTLSEIEAALADYGKWRKELIDSVNRARSIRREK